MIRRLEDALLSSSLVRGVLFNRVTGTFAEYVEAARKRHRYAAYRDRYDVSPEFEFRGPGIELYGRGDIDLGTGSYIGHHSRIQSKRDTAVTVGANTAISHYVFLYTENRVADQDMSTAPNRNRHLDVRRGDVAIGDDCWIGAFTFVTEGVSIGENAVVGAHSVVTDDLPPHSVAAGTPARVRKFKSYLPADRTRALAEAYEGVLDEDVRARYV